MIDMMIGFSIKKLELKVIRLKTIKCPFCDFENDWEGMILNHLEVKHQLRKGA
jgi:hypothetical protein